MTDPIVERIRQNLISAVASVTVANGYSADITAEPVARYGNDTNDLTAVVEQGEEEIVDNGSSGAGAVGHQTYRQIFRVFISIRNPESDGNDFDRRCNLAASDVRKAVMADVTRAGLALHTELQPNQLFVNGNGEIAGVVVVFVVLYQTKLDDPFTL